MTEEELKAKEEELKAKEDELKAKEDELTKKAEDNSNIGSKMKKEFDDQIAKTKADYDEKIKSRDDIISQLIKGDKPEDKNKSKNDIINNHNAKIDRLRKM